MNAYFNNYSSTTTTEKLFPLQLSTSSSSSSDFSNKYLRLPIPQPVVQPIIVKTTDVYDIPIHHRFSPHTDIEIRDIFAIDNYRLKNPNKTAKSANVIVNYDIDRFDKKEKNIKNGSIPHLMPLTAPINQRIQVSSSSASSSSSSSSASGSASSKTSPNREKSNDVKPFELPSLTMQSQDPSQTIQQFFLRGIKKNLNPTITKPNEFISNSSNALIINNSSNFTGNGTNSVSDFSTTQFNNCQVDTENSNIKKDDDNDNSDNNLNTKNFKQKYGFERLTRFNNEICNNRRKKNELFCYWYKTDNGNLYSGVVDIKH